MQVDKKTYSLSTLLLAPWQIYCKIDWECSWVGHNKARKLHWDANIPIKNRISPQINHRFHWLLTTTVFISSNSKDMTAPSPSLQPKHSTCPQLMGSVHAFQHAMQIRGVCVCVCCWFQGRGGGVLSLFLSRIVAGLEPVKSQSLFHNIYLHIINIVLHSPVAEMRGISWWPAGG